MPLALISCILSKFFNSAPIAHTLMSPSHPPLANTLLCRMQSRATIQLECAFACLYIGFFFLWDHRFRYPSWEADINFYSLMLRTRSIA